MGFGSKLGQLVGNTAGELIESVGKTVDRFVTTDEDRQRAEQVKQEFALKVKEWQFEMMKAEFEDRQSARAMYEKDSSLQKVFAMTFLVGYLGISGVLLYVVLSWLGLATAPEIPAWAISLISTIFGAMSSKVNTIVDFLFGGSAGERDTGKEITKAFQGASQAKNTA